MAPLSLDPGATWIEVQNIGCDFAKAALVTWGEPGFCPPQAAGPLKVECTGMLKPGSTWNLLGARVPTGSKSGILFQFTTKQLSEIGVDLGFDDIVGDYLCETLFFGVVGDAANAIEPGKRMLSSMSPTILLQDGEIELVVCMGDTLTHLETLTKVKALLQQVSTGLAPGGRLILSFRNLSQPLVGLDRFIPVRADADTVFTCFLEYEPETVKVHDLVYARDVDGAMTLNKSMYRKLRLPLEARAAADEPEPAAPQPVGRISIRGSAVRLVVVADPTVVPPEQGGFYDEAIVRMPDFYLPFDNTLEPAAIDELRKGGMERQIQRLGV